MAFVYDKEGTLPVRINLEDVFYQQQMTDYWENFLLMNINEHYNLTNSNHAKNLINNWNKAKYLFWQIAPKEMISKFKKPVLIEEIQRA